MIDMGIVTPSNIKIIANFRNKISAVADILPKTAER